MSRNLLALLVLLLTVTLVGCGGASHDGGRRGDGNSGDDDGVDDDQAGGGDTGPDCCTDSNECQLEENSICDCGGSFEDTWDLVDCLPETFSVDFHGALIGPAKSDRTTWDGNSAISDADWATLLALNPSTAPYGELAGFLADLAMSTLYKPDPFGYMELNRGNGYDPELLQHLATEGNNIQDSFQPMWPSPLTGYTGVPFNEDMRIRTRLWDKDLLNNDPIGAAVIGFDHILEAYLDEGVYWVNVADQTQQQLLMLAIEVY